MGLAHKGSISVGEQNENIYNHNSYQVPEPKQNAFHFLYENSLCLLFFMSNFVKEESRTVACQKHVSSSEQIRNLFKSL